MRRTFLSFKYQLEFRTCLNLSSYDREFNLDLFRTDLSQFGLEMKKLWPKRTEKGLFVKILCFQGLVCEFSRAWYCNLGF